MNLPDPLTPADCDLQDFAFMPLDVARLRDSDLASLETPEACWAAVLLWCASWHQVPAASLPDDDRVLANLAGFGRVVREWMKVKEGALRGWIKCSDGRLYHPVVVEKAITAWRSKLEQAWKTELARIKKHNQRHPDNQLKEVTFDEYLSLRTAATCPKDKQPLSQGQNGTVPDLSLGKQHPIDRERDRENIKPSVNDTLPSNPQTHGASSQTPGQKLNGYGPIAVELIELGIQVTSIHPTLQAWVDEGITIERLRECVAIARQSKPAPEKIPANYLDRILREQPKAQKPKQVAWHATEQGMLAKGAELGMQPRPGEGWPEFKQRIFDKLNATGGK